MSLSSLAPQPSAHGDPAPAREAYARCAFRLGALGHVPGFELSHLAFRLLVFLLHQRPGYVAHYETIADGLDSNRDSIRREVHRLREAGLLRCELIPPHHRLPTGRYARTNVLRFLVDVDSISARLTPTTDLSERRRDGEPRAKPPSSTGANSPSSTGSLPRFVKQPPSSKTSTGEHRVQPVVATAMSENDLETGGKEDATPAELEDIARAWNALGGLGEVGIVERRALENRRREGALLEELHAAVVAAGACSWLRTHARSPFAVVFASVASVRRFAHQWRSDFRQSLSTNPAAASRAKPLTPRASPRADARSALEGQLTVPVSAARALRSPGQPATVPLRTTMPASARAALAFLGVAWVPLGCDGRRHRGRHSTPGASPEDNPSTNCAIPDHESPRTTGART